MIYAGEVPGMQDKDKEVWLDVCARAAIEQDPDELLRLAREIDRLLEEKEQRLRRKTSRYVAS
jgi:hypothetical protein